MNKNKVSDMAKDFGLTSKDILSVLSTYEDGSKKPSQVLSADEVNLIFEHLTQKHQVKIESIYAESAPQKKTEPKAAPAPAQNQPKANNAQNQPRNNNNNGGSRPQPQQGQQGKPAQPQQNTQPVQQQSKSTATQHPTTRVPEKKIVDTRKVTNVNLDKYDEKLQDMAERSGDRRDLERGSKEKFRNSRNRNNRQQPFSGKRKQEEAEKMRRLQLEIAKKTPLTVKIPDEISVGELASRMKKTGAEVVKCLMKNGVMASLSQMIDFDTASFVAEELGCKVEKEVVVTIEEKLIDDHKDSADELQPRAPVVVVMGHVDHGKTSLLDYIRNAHVASGEAGGITQHIGAYQVQIKGKPITFLDTPGHEAFTSMRARGAMITDIAILVVAAEDGIKPQTIESINHAKAAEIPIIVAINKMDKPDANPERIKQQLTEYGLVAEDWGGDTIVCPISAKTGMGIDNLLEMVALTAEVAELKANPNRAASGAVVKADVMGSVEAVKASLEKISNDEVRVRVIHGAVGAINESDVMLAATSNAIIVGFNVRPDAAARDSAARNHVDMRMYRVIYDAIDEIEAAMKGMLAPKFREAIIGHAEIRQTYKVSSVGTVAGCYVTDGKIQRACDVRIVRDGIVVHEGHLASLQRFKDSVKEVAQGYECGLSFEKYNDIKVGDIVEAYVMEQIEQ